MEIHKLVPKFKWKCSRTAMVILKIKKKNSAGRVAFSKINMLKKILVLKDVWHLNRSDK